MGDYNPDQPHILGEEWVPIRDENVTLSPVVNSVETGHRFSLGTARQVRDGRFYLNTLPSGDATGQTFMIGVYEAGEEALSGPIASVIIPCDNGGVTGNVSIFLATTVAEAVADPSDAAQITMSSGSPATSRVSAFFNVNDYAALLIGKRILGVNLLYVITGDWAELNAVSGQFTISIADNAGQTAFYGDNTRGTLAQVESSDTAREISRLRFGEINQFWSSTLSPYGTPDRMPWTYAGLARFEAGAANRIQVRLDMNESTSFIGIEIEYLALEVIYCEEQRVALGARAFGLGFAPISGNAFRPYTIGANTIPLRTVAEVADPVLAAGDYTMVLSSADVGDFIWLDLVSTIPYPLLNGARQLYGISPHPAVQVDIPFPLEDHLGDTFTLFEPAADQVSRILPQLSLHASGGTLTEPHVYGRQLAAQVYAAHTATQDIDDTTVAAASYEQVRFYARRFGSTRVDLQLTDGASTVSLSPAEWDALTEIVDGWKEVTLSFASPPTMGASSLPTWTFSAAGEDKGSRWEILGACAPAISGLVGNLLNQVAAPNQLDEATYQPPIGSTINAAWMPLGCGSPYVSGTTADPHSDLTLIFSQDPPTVTGLTLTPLTQTVTGIGLDCGDTPCCIPTGIDYHRLTWTTDAVCDTFSRTETDQWGTADSGQVWATAGGVATDYDVGAGVGTIALSTVGSRNLVIGSQLTDVDMTFYATTPQTALGDSYNISAIARWTDGNNLYIANAVMNTTGNVGVVIRKRVAAVTTNLITISNVFTYAAGDLIGIRFQVIGTDLRCKIWNATGGVAEPDTWTAETTDGDLTVGQVGVRAERNSLNTNVGLVIAVDDFTAAPPVYSGARFELQRYDQLTGQFETIMLGSDMCTYGFNDYEARVGVDSVYRIRIRNLLNFAGPWSTQVTGNIETPGITGGCDDNTGALIFTSNADQSGASNAAYMMQWESTPSEDFTLPEADEVIFQRLYGRDGSVAFHGSERGLETFTRTLLIQAAAIDPIRLADVETLRDLAWADLPYVCVRDEISDRWFATVRVPAVNARHNRTKYMARVEIVETTRIPAQVDP